MVVYCNYAGPWLDGKPPVFLVGVNYDPKKRGHRRPARGEGIAAVCGPKESLPCRKRR